MSLTKTPLPLLAIVILLITAEVVVAQVKPSPPRRLRNPATVRGFIGGESHDRYVIRVRKGRTLKVSISWTPEADNKASFSVSDSLDFSNGEPVKFGTASDDGTSWTGVIPKTGDYYIDVIAHPSAHYTLRVKIK